MQQAGSRLAVAQGRTTFDPTIPMHTLSKAACTTADHCCPSGWPALSTHTRCTLQVPALTLVQGGAVCPLGLSQAARAWLNKYSTWTPLQKSPTRQSSHCTALNTFYPPASLANPKTLSRLCSHRTSIDGMYNWGGRSRPLSSLRSAAHACQNWCCEEPCRSFSICKCTPCREARSTRFGRPGGSYEQRTSREDFLTPAKTMGVRSLLQASGWIADRNGCVAGLK